MKIKSIVTTTLGVLTGAAVVLVPAPVWAATAVSPGAGVVGGGTTVTVDVPSAEVGFLHISTHRNIAVAFGDDGNLWSWGPNGQGQFGEGSNNNSTLPVQVTPPTGVTFTQVSTGAGFVVALSGDGAAYAWGTTTPASWATPPPTTATSRCR